MFETSLLSERRGKDARLVRWIAFGSVAGQVIAVAAFVLYPLIYPESLPLGLHAGRLTRLETRARPRPLIKPVVNKLKRAVNHTALPAPVHVAATMMKAHASGMLSRVSSPTMAEEPLLAVGGGSMAGPINTGTGPGGIAGLVSGTAPQVTVRAAAPVATGGPVRVSQGVSRGLLLAPMRPVYPGIAKIARVQGTVIVTAVIDRTGRIVNVQVVDGPPMLREAAAAAVREARYQPYLLNGQPTEVVTTISVTFRMDG